MVPIGTYLHELVVPVMAMLAVGYDLAAAFVKALDWPSANVLAV